MGIRACGERGLRSSRTKDGEVPSPVVEWSFDAAELAITEPNCEEAASSWSFLGSGGGRSCFCSREACWGSEGSKVQCMLV